MMDLQTINILILENNSMDMRDLTCKLKHSIPESHIYPSSTCDEAYLTTRLVPIHLALVNLSMTESNGMDFLVTLHKDASIQDIPVIVTAAPDLHRLVLPFAEGIGAKFLDKPVEKDDIYELIKITINSTIDRYDLRFNYSRKNVQHPWAQSP